MTKILLPLLLALYALSAPVAAADDNQNAAYWYRRAMERFGDYSPEDWEAMDTYTADPTRDPPPHLRGILARLRPVLDNLQRGARQSYSDFQHPYEDGFDLVLPHLQPLRRIGTLLRLDAYVQLHDGNPAGAAEAVGSLYQLGGHLGEDRILVSSLVGSVEFKRADIVLQAMLDQGAIDPTIALNLLQTSSKLNPRDPFNFVEALAMEQEIALATLQNTFNEEEGAEKLAEYFGMDGEPIQAIAELTPDEFAQDLTKYDAMMTRVVEAYADTDPERAQAELKGIEKDLEAGEFGQIAQVMTPALLKYYGFMDKTREQLADRMKLLRGIAHGDINPLQQANAAHWYLRAAELLESKPAADLKMLRAYDLEFAPTLTKELTEFLEKAADIQGILREASIMRNCDFSFTRPILYNDIPDAPVLAPPYAVGLRDLERLLTLDALYQLRSGNQKPLADRLTLGFTLSIHLSSDPIFTSALTAHLAFNQLTTLTTSALDIKLLSPASKAKLRAIVHRIPRRDPFGYIGALIEARQQMTHYYNWVIPEGVTQQELQKRAKAVINTIRPHRLLYFAAILDTMRRTDKEQPPLSLTPLHDIYNLQSLTQVQSETPEISPLLTAGNPEQLIKALKNQTIPEIAPLHRKTLDARRDLRKTLNLLKPKK